MLTIELMDLVKTVQNRLSELGASAADRMVILQRFESEQPYSRFEMGEVFSATLRWTTAELQAERAKAHRR